MDCSENEIARIAPGLEPLPHDIQQAIDAVMRGKPSLVLFTTLARDRRPHRQLSRELAAATVRTGR